MSPHSCHENVSAQSTYTCLHKCALFRTMLIFIVFLPRISYFDPSVAKSLSAPSAHKYLNLTLMGFGTSMDEVHFLVENLHSDIHNLIQKL